LFLYPHAFSENAIMSNVINEKPTSAIEIEAQSGSNAAPAYDVNEKDGLNRAGAIDAENIEHNMTVLQAVKAYPAASWWAFVMSCTIVSSLQTTNEETIGC
jgi:SP family general alpha glucoside:H+ symporter-like MFS transporter